MSFAVILLGGAISAITGTCVASFLERKGYPMSIQLLGFLIGPLVALCIGFAIS